MKPVNSRLAVMIRGYGKWTGSNRSVEKHLLRRDLEVARGPGDPPYLNGRRKRLPHGRMARLGGRARIRRSALPEPDVFFITIGGLQADGHSLTVAARKGVGRGSEAGTRRKEGVGKMDRSRTAP
jgi:hypothetical protein